MAGTDPLQDFRWSEQPQATAAITQLVAHGLAQSSTARSLTDRLFDHSGTRLVDWLASIVVPADGEIRSQLLAAGFIPDRATGPASGSTSSSASGATVTVLRHPGGLFPSVIWRPGHERVHLVLAVDGIADFLTHHDLPRDALSTSGHLLQVSPDHSAAIWVNDDPLQRDSELAAGAAWGTASVANGPARAESDQILQQFRSRQRDFPDQTQGFAAMHALLTQAINRCGRDQAAVLFFTAEREYWQARNRAAQVQKGRQDALGMGWANHDHHTYRSSRSCFARMIALFELLGFTCRERFYPGGAAGWGAQVMEHQATGLVIFADVDMNSRELREDFAHQPFSENRANRALGTVGLWCALHGESLFSAGMHHLACKVDFNRVRPLLAQERIQAMKPFSDYPYLQQCFTVGEYWPVRMDRLEYLEREAQISPEQAEHFRQGGALGSHLELVERNSGFKGFNQHGVDEIIAGTDPRHQQGG